MITAAVEIALVLVPETRKLRFYGIVHASVAKLNYSIIH